jgi:transcriptional regulator with XRE-family HTH domain
MLSKLERGKLFPTLPMLLRIAMVFSVGLDYFFTDERKRHVVAIARKKKRVRFPERPGNSDVTHHFESLDFNATERKLSAFFAEFEPVRLENMRNAPAFRVEFLYLIRGKIDLIIGSDVHTLDAGDAIYFDSSVRHGYRRASMQPSTAVVVTAP